MSFSHSSSSRPQGPVARLREITSRPYGAAKSHPLLHGEEPFTLLHNLRTRPLTFVVACFGLMAVLAVKTVLVRESSAASKAKTR